MGVNIFTFVVVIFNNNTKYYWTITLLIKLIDGWYAIDREIKYFDVITIHIVCGNEYQQSD